MDTDTIAARITPAGEGGIAVIRVSGPEAIEIVDRIYQGKESLQGVASHTVCYGYIVDPVNGEKVDEVLVTVMRSPKTFTCEDVVEISCHGGHIMVQRILQSVLQVGARLAEPGEFTKRAFLNGRIDLSQAEAVMELICAKTTRAAKAALHQLAGGLSVKIQNLRHEILSILAHLSVNIDYPEYDTEQLTEKQVLQLCGKIEEEIDQLLLQVARGQILKKGLLTAMVGRPNVGKSSLMNVLTQEDKSIVTSIPGTTRDIIEEYVSLRGIPLRLLDTAGIRQTEDEVEKIGVERSYAALQQADLILLLLNYAEPLEKEDIELLSLLQDQKGIIIINKVDLPQKIDLERIKSMVGDTPVLFMSMKEEKGIGELEEAVEKMFLLSEDTTQEDEYITHERHVHLLKKAKRHIQDTVVGIQEGVPLDMVEVDIQDAWQALGEVIGEAVAEDLLDQIFSQFCLGK